MSADSQVGKRREGADYPTLAFLRGDDVGINHSGRPRRKRKLAMRDVVVQCLDANGSIISVYVDKNGDIHLEIPRRTTVFRDDDDDIDTDEEYAALYGDVTSEDDEDDEDEDDEDDDDDSVDSASDDYVPDDDDEEESDDDDEGDEDEDEDVSDGEGEETDEEDTTWLEDDGDFVDECEKGVAGTKRLVRGSDHHNHTKRQRNK